MPKAKRSRSGMLTSAAEAVGATLGRVVGTLDRLRADHPHPVAEAQQALSDVRETLAAAAAEADQAAEAASRKTRKRVRRVRRTAAAANVRIKKAVAPVKRPKR